MTDEKLLATIQDLGDNAYGVTILRSLGEPISLGALYLALERLEEAGLIKSEYRDATPERGGRKKRFITRTSDPDPASQPNSNTKEK